MLAVPAISDSPTTGVISINVPPIDTLQIGNGSATNYYLPTNSYYYFSLSQQIYTVA